MIIIFKDKTNINENIEQNNSNIPINIPPKNAKIPPPKNIKHPMNNITKNNSIFINICFNKNRTN